jgi:hypothetical protein
MKPNSEAYRAAAERLFERKEEYACIAIDKWLGIGWGEDYSFESKLFQYMFILGTPLLFGPSLDDQCREHRVIALLLMAEITEGGGHVYL